MSVRRSTLLSLLLSGALCSACASGRDTSTLGPDGGIIRNEGGVMDMGVLPPPPGDGGLDLSTPPLPEGGTPGAVDDPDDTFADTNGDGIDGDVTKAIFVAVGGNERGAGTREDPIGTIQAGIEFAMTLRKPHVYVASGTYQETVSLRGGVSIYGGYDRARGWMRAATNETIILGPATGSLRAESALGGAVVDRFTVRSGDPREMSESSIGVVLAGASALTLSNLRVFSGVGTPGRDGTDARGMGAPGMMGRNGGNGCEDSDFLCDSCSRPTPGPGGASPCGANGGVGGTAGHPDNGSPGMGGSGTRVVVNAMGMPMPMPGAAGGGTGTRGTDGMPGDPGMPGMPGGAFGAWMDGAYVPANGTDGTDGGHGGGGGGGGGGNGGDSGCNSYGGGGGGGGGGGCGSDGGTGGGGGGASLGIVVDRCMGVTMRAIEITTGNGGMGGRGGAGAEGGGGGPGGPGGGGEDDSQPGGAGGNGGAGGRGGAGGGGGGGPSVAIVTFGGAAGVTVMGLRSTLGMGGAGGAGPMPGMTGQAIERLDL